MHRWNTTTPITPTPTTVTTTDRLPLPARFKERVTAGQKVTFGLRPDDLYPAGHGIHSGEDADVHDQELRVILTEPLGNETLVFSDFGGAEWVGRMLNPRRLTPDPAF